MTEIDTQCERALLARKSGPVTHSAGSEHVPAHQLGGEPAALAGVACPTCGETHVACLLFGGVISPNAPALGALLRRGWPVSVVRMLVRVRGVVCRNCLWKAQSAARRDHIE